jgi:hypothetical protein
VARVLHLLLTRFNVPHPDYARDKRGAATGTPAWLAHRFELFERFCLPSVRGQRPTDFAWLVAFDAATPAPLRGRIDGYRALPVLRPIFAAHFDELPDRVRAEVPEDVEFLISSRLDNDDALARDALWRVRREFREQALEFLNPRVGYILSRGRVHRATCPSNPFLSLIERRGARPWLTAWGVAHDRARDAGPVRDLGPPAYWLQTVHERNLKNDWGDRWDHALQPLKDRVRRLGARVGGPPEREARVTPTSLRLEDLAEEFALEP